MNNIILDKICRESKVSGKYFAGVFTINEIPRQLKPPSCFIVNTDPKGEPGTHWISCYDTINSVNIFDSLGSNVEKNTYFNDYLFSTTRAVYKNACRIQSPKSDICGIYSLIFIYYMTNGGIYENFLKMFKPQDEIANDIVACSLFKQYYDKECLEYNLTYGV
jgi:hypothetical protein